MLSSSEENYLKAIFKLAEKTNTPASTNAISKLMHTTPASVTNMLQKLYCKGLVQYKKYHGVSFTKKGLEAAKSIIRRQGLWELFLVKHLRFSWENVPDIADKLEHINSEELILRLDAFLNYPKYNPFGVPIPDKDGKITIRSHTTLSNLHKGEKCKLIAVKSYEKPFLTYLNELQIKIGTVFSISEQHYHNHSTKVWIENKKEVILSKIISDDLVVCKV